jgi:hypothetical protein
MFHALRQGLRHVTAVPGLLAFLWLVNLLVAVPAAVVVGEAIHDSAKWSTANESLREGFDTGWFGEFKADAQGLAATFEASQIGVGSTFDALEAWWSGGLFRLPPSIIVLGAVFAGIWLFLMGGILSRLHRPWDRWRLGDLLAAGSEYFPRFVRLGVLSGALYYGILRLSAWLFPWLQEASRDVTSETRVLGYNLVAAGLIIGLLVGVKAVFDYAKISMVVDGRRSALSAALRGVGFVLSRPLAAGGLVALFGSLTAFIVVLYSLVAPGAEQSSPATILLAIAASQLFLVVRLTLRLGLLGSELALFERRHSQL